jgi:uncharacterized membrane protein YkvA (DUF1232 family)
MPTTRMGRSARPRGRSRTAVTAKPKAAAFLEPADVRQLVLEMAARIAPGDVVELLRHERQLRARIAGVASPHLALFHDQLSLATDCLRDHARGRCPQIPYHTIGLLAGALWYYVDELDAVPDFLPHVGQLDDAVVLAMAFELAEDGLRRYCDWKGLSADGLFGRSAARRLLQTTPPRKKPPGR